MTMYPYRMVANLSPQLSTPITAPVASLISAGGNNSEEAIIKISRRSITLPADTFLYFTIIRATISVPPVLPP